MQRIHVTAGQFSEAAATAARCLLDGGVVVFPTDTVYGLAVHPAHPKALVRLKRIKGRDAAKPIALLASDLVVVRQAGYRLSKAAVTLATHFWPGPLTLVFPGPGGADDGLRVPNHDLAREILRRAGGLLRVTSANLSGEPPAVDAHTASTSVGPSVDLLLDAGPCPGGEASTVVRVCGEAIQILRNGPVDRAAIAALVDVPAMERNDA